VLVKKVIDIIDIDMFVDVMLVDISIIGVVLVVGCEWSRFCAEEFDIAVLV
jgi:hypothetical protein